MPTDEDLEKRLEAVPLARSRALHVLGAVLFGAALRLAAPELARAADGPVPFPCAGFGQCHCCSGSTCCEDPCTWDGVSHCPSGAQCWYTCIPSTGDVYRCCDWHSSTGHCICSELTPLTC